MKERTKEKTGKKKTGPKALFGRGSKEPVLTEEEIREAAYFRWLERGAPHGEHMDDWFEAEKSLKGKKK